MKIVWTAELLILIHSCSVFGVPYSDAADYDYDAENSDLLVDKGTDANAASKSTELEMTGTPKFVTAPQNIVINEGDTVRLPCIVERLEGFVLLWKRESDIITVANQIIDKRVQLEEETNGNYLILGQAGPEDSGEYTCQISAYKPTEITHSLTIRVEPVISTVPDSTLTVPEGSPVKLECSLVSGTPLPELSWIKGEHKVDGEVLEIEEISRDQAGAYRCLGSNGFGPTPVEKEVTVEVTYAPEIEVEEAYIVTNVDAEQEIVCVVNSSPAADVSWKINDTPLDSDSPGIVLTHKENRHSLLIISASNHSVGRYSCTARNELGEAIGVADISGEAGPAVILSSHISDKTNEFNLEWSVESESPIDMFEVAVKEEGEAKWDLHEVIVDTDNNNTSINDTSEADSIHRGELLLTNLEPSTSYEVTIASKNSFGMGSRGDIFTFKTIAIEPKEPEEDVIIETEIGQNKTEKLEAETDKVIEQKITSSASYLVCSSIALITFLAFLSFK